MRIAFDSIALLGAMSKNRGIGNYALDLFSTILAQDQNNEYFLFNVLEDTDYFQEEVAQGKLKREDFCCIHKGRFFPLRDMQTIYGELVRAYIHKNKIDVFIITSPFDAQYPTYQKEWFAQTKVVTIVYDIIPYVMKDYYFSCKEDMGWYLEKLEQLLWADQLLVISQSVKDDLMEHLNISGENIHVIWGAPGKKFQKIQVSQQQKKDICKKFKIDSPFVMCTGGDDERKNLAGLITAFGRLSKELIRNYQLVIVCKLQKAAVKRYTELAEKCGVKGRVVLTNFVSNEELVALYNLASLVAFPSVYEGFGLPVVEAWACGTPVLTSSNSSLGQIGGEAAILVDPHSNDDIAKGLETALHPEMLEKLNKLGQERLQRFQWEKVAADTVNFISKLETSAKEVSSFKKKIAFFTPLPPLQSGISDYSVDIVDALSRYFNIDVYVDTGYQIDCKLPDSVTCRVHTEYKVHRSEYVDTVFQIGNSEYHIYMWGYIQTYGGTMVLHDYNLHGVVQFETLARNKNDIEGYRKLLLQDFPRTEVEQYLTSVAKGEPLKIHEMEMNGFLSNYADKIIVHSKEAKEKLLRRDIRRDVTHIQSYVRIEPLVDSSIAKKELGLSEERFVFAAFGHIHETKRVLPIVKAFAKLAAEHQEIMLIFVGKLDSGLAPKFQQLVEKLGISDQVQVTGYTKIEQFRQYIDATDVCLNLRWPYNGETSGSLMRILGKGKCVVVNNIGSFGEIPDEACVKLPSVEAMKEKQEIEKIYQAMKVLYENPDKRHALEHAARSFAEEYLDLNVIAQQYQQVLLKPASHFVSEALLYRLREDLKYHDLSQDELKCITKILTYVK